MVEEIKKSIGVKESDTGLALPSQWNLQSDQKLMQEKPLHVAVCTKIIDPNTASPKYFINLKQIAKFVVGLGKNVAPSDIDDKIESIQENGQSLFETLAQVPWHERVAPRFHWQRVLPRPKQMEQIFPWWFQRVDL